MNRGLVAALALAAATFGAAGEVAPMQGRHAAITVKVPAFLDAEKHVLEYAAQNGLQVTAKDATSTPKGRRHGWIKLTLPEARLETTLVELGNLGKIVATKRWSDDLASYRRELSDRQELLKAHNTRLSGLLTGRSLRVRDKLYIFDLLFQNRAAQDELNRELGKIDQQAQVATVNLTMFEPYLATETPATQMGPRKKLAALGSTLAGIVADGISWFAEILLKLLIYSPIWLPALIFGKKWIKKSGAFNPAPTSPSGPSI